MSFMREARGDAQGSTDFIWSFPPAALSEKPQATGTGWCKAALRPGGQGACTYGCPGTHPGHPGLCAPCTHTAVVSNHVPSEDVNEDREER